MKMWWEAAGMIIKTWEHKQDSSEDNIMLMAKKRDPEKKIIYEKKAHQMCPVVH